VSRIEQLLAKLSRFHGRLPSPPDKPFVLFVWEILSVHSTPRKRDAALAVLKRTGALTPDEMWRTPQKKLEDALGLAGPYVDQRIRELRIGVEVFKRSPDLPAVIRGPLPAARRALKALPQMGEGGGYRMLLFAGGHRVLPVDARLSRVSRRLGYGESHAGFAATAKSIRAAVASELPDTLEAYRRAFVYLNHHGAGICTDADPLCHECPLRSDCPEGIRRDQE
jgi:endonuclease III